MWSAQGPLDNWYAEGPVTLWRDWADDVTGYPLKGGHFFPEAAPQQTADALRRFFSGSE
jgi:haloacetate dehalogenase